MYYSRIIVAIILIIIAYTTTITVSSCANIVPPVGGSKDSTAPTLLKASPINNTLNNTNRTISFDFDEYVELEDAANNITISPLPNITPTITSKLRNVTIKLKDSLQANTTYTITINGAIKDVNEGNKLNNFKYTFSTGSYIDSNTLSGTVIQASTGKVDSTLIVMLHTSSLDSAVVKLRPQYTTTVKADGSFTFNNLPAKPYYIYALKDEGNQKKYYSTKQAFAYNNTSVSAANNTADIKLYTYEQATTATPVADKPNTAERLRVTTSANAGNQDILTPLTLTYNKALKSVDTTKIKLTDTTYNTKYAITIAYDSITKSYIITTKWIPATMYRLVVFKEFAKDDKGNYLPKTDTLKFSTKAATDYGKVTVRFNNLNLAANNVLQLIQSERIVQAYPITGLKLTIAQLLPGEYTLRLLADDNRNGVWDTGNFFGIKKQPEIVKDLNKKITIKADWDNEVDVD